jgi:hypothetical protein
MNLNRIKNCKTTRCNRDIVVCGYAHETDDRASEDKHGGEHSGARESETATVAGDQ